MTTKKLPRDKTRSPEVDIQIQLQTSFCKLLKYDETSGSKLFQIVYGFIIYNGQKDELWQINAESVKFIEPIPTVLEYAEKQYDLLIKSFQNK